MSDLQLTTAARRHAQRHGLTPGLLQTVLHHADLETPVGHGCSQLRLSFEAILRLRDEHAASVCDRAKNVILIVTDRAVVAVLRASECARRGWKRDHR